MLTTLYDTPHMRVEHDPMRRIVFVRRSALRYETLEAAVRTFREAARSLVSIDRASHALLADLREAPGRNDDAFESAIAQPRLELLAGFARRASLVRTVAGRMQEKRLSRSSPPSEFAVFEDELEATGYLMAWP
jgi:hypothetical protein